jgi:hypothetical protein
MELPEKIESNLVSYLQSLTFPAYFTPDLVHPGESDEDKTTQVIQAVCAESENEDPPYSGNFWFPVQIELRTPLFLQTDDEKASADPEFSAQIAKHKAVAAVLADAIDIDDLIAQINTTAQAQTDTDLKAFAAIAFTDRKPLREQNDKYIMSGWSLKFYANSNADAA